MPARAGWQTEKNLQVRLLVWAAGWFWAWPVGVVAGMARSYRRPVRYGPLAQAPRSAWPARTGGPLIQGLVLGL